MSAMLEGLTKQLNEVGEQVDRLEDERADQEKARADLADRMSAARQAIDGGASDKAAQEERLKNLTIEDEQLAEAQRKTQHQLKEAKKRLTDLEREISMLEDSSIV